MNTFCQSLVEYKRRETIDVKIGDLSMGSNFPIRIQSMTTTDTMDTAGSVAQIKRMVDAGCELVRLTAPSINEARNLENIKKALKADGIHVPLVADIHFTPNAAEMAARLVEKVRINPGNYADKKKFEIFDYTDDDYEEELERIREKFVPLVKICKNYGTAMRIGTNHGSLSDRIMSRYGDTPMGMVESAMEFLRIANAENFHNIVLSMKSSNPQVMVQAYRLLVKTMNENNMHYPLHLGVTEAGDGDDGRIKSALGIGALLEDGIGDTIRVSLTEDPEFEVPVAKMLAKRYENRNSHAEINAKIILNEGLPVINDRENGTWNPYAYAKRKTDETYNFGGHQVPRVIADLSKIQTLSPTQLSEIGHVFNETLDKWTMLDVGADYVFLGENKAPFMLPMGLQAIYNLKTWIELVDKQSAFPLINLKEIENNKIFSSTLNFISLDSNEMNQESLELIKTIKNAVLIVKAGQAAKMPELRNLFFFLEQNNFHQPIVIQSKYDSGLEEAMLHTSTDVGSLLIDGFGDGIMISAENLPAKRLNDICFGILQAARVRISKTEYISCPSCGRTLFDLQETTAKIRKQTDHLKGIKIAIMGCIVNGPGEMADADYGYVGSGPGKITLYKGKELVKKGVNTEFAVNELINLIKENGDWTEISE
jgi:(E)-4-hydroxy-3-methylbut-2-enyl-diphosphate synthase